MSNNQILCFVAWLLKKNLTGTTINSYISGLRTLHLVKGYDQKALRQPIITALEEGKSHLDTIRARLESKPNRLPVTINVLKLLKATINTWEEPNQMRLLVWTVCLICFFGGFRIHGKLSKKTVTYDPAFTLLGKDIRVVEVKVGT